MIGMSSISQKILASWVNMAFVLSLSVPIFFITDLNWWRIDTITLFALYNVAFFNQRDLGMRAAGTFYLDGKEQGLVGAALYTTGFATLFYWVWFPADLFLVNGAAQIVCLLLTGNTLHGWLSDTVTLNVAGHLQHNYRWKWRHERALD